MVTNKMSKKLLLGAIFLAVQLLVLGINVEANARILGFNPEMLVYGYVFYENGTIAPGVTVNIHSYHDGWLIDTGTAISNAEGKYMEGGNLEVVSAGDMINVSSPSGDSVQHIVTESEFISLATMINLTVLDGGNHDPIIDYYYPSENPVMKINEEILFVVNASDLDGDELNYSWFLDEVLQDEDTNLYLFEPGEIKEYSLKALVNDSLSFVEKIWNIIVTPVNFIMTFADGSSEVELNFNESNEQEFVIEIPSDMVIKNAVVRIG